MAFPSSHSEDHNAPFASSMLQRRARGVLALFFVLLGLYTIRTFMPALLWGCVFAICLWPLYRKAEMQLGRSLWLPAGFTAILALVFLVPVSFITYKTVDEVQSALHWMDSIRQTGLPIPPWINHLPFGATQARTWWQSHLSQSEHVNELFHSLNLGHGMQVTRQVSTQVRELIHRIILFGFSMLTLFFLLRDSSGVILKFLRGSQRLFGPQGETLARQIILSVHGTLAGLVLVGLGEGLIMGIVYIFTATPQPLIFGLATAVASMIPVLGWIAIGIVGLLVLAKGGMIGAFTIWGIGAVVLFVADHFIRPVLIGGSTKMPFLWVLIGIFGGVETWGLLGLFLGPAIMAALHLLWNYWTAISVKTLSEKDM